MKTIDPSMQSSTVELIKERKKEKKKDYIKMFDLPAMFLISEVEDHFRGNTEVPVKCLCTTFVLENYALSTPVLHCA